MYAHICIHAYLFASTRTNAKLQELSHTCSRAKVGARSHRYAHTDAHRSKYLLLQIEARIDTDRHAHTHTHAFSQIDTHRHAKVYMLSLTRTPTQSKCVLSQIDTHRRTQEQVCGLTVKHTHKHRPKHTYTRIFK